MFNVYIGLLYICTCIYIVYITFLSHTSYELYVRPTYFLYLLLKALYACQLSTFELTIECHKTRQNPVMSACVKYLEGDVGKMRQNIKLPFLHDIR